MNDIKWISKEARIITEQYDQENASGFKTKHLGEKDDYMGAITRQVSEQSSWLDIAIRAELIRNINLKFNVNLKINAHWFKHNNKEVDLLREIPGGTPPRVWTGNLKEMHSSMFRETIAECLAIIPGALKHFRELAERTPYFF